MQTDPVNCFIEMTMGNYLIQNTIYQECMLHLQLLMQYFYKREIIFIV